MAISQTPTRYNKRRYRKPKTLRQRVAELEKDIPDPETKYLDTNINTTITSAGIIQDLSIIPSGAFESNRIGNRVKNTSHYWNMNLIMDPDATHSVVRLIFFIWKPSIDTSHPSPAVSYILQSASVISPYNRLYTADYRTLYDKSFVLAPGQSSAQVDKWYKKVWNYVQFIDSLGEEGAGKLFLLMISDVTVNPPLIAATHRLNYDDA